MNFAYNMLANLTKLEHILLNQFRPNGEQLEVEVRQFKDGVTERKYFHEGEDKVLCRIVDKPNSKVYYEKQKRQKRKKGTQRNSQEHEAKTSGSEWAVRINE